MHRVPAQQRPPAAADAFTLVELLVSMAVLTLLIVFVSQMVSGATKLTTSSHQHLDADEEARLVFDRMGLDFSRMLKRTDVDYIFSTATSETPGANDAFYFYSEAPGYLNGTTTANAESSITLVGYRIDPSIPANPQLSRLGKALTWDEGGGATPGAVVYLSPAATPSADPTPTPDPASTLAGHWPATLGTAPTYNATDTTCYHVLSDQVCRLEVCFLLKPVAATATTASLPAIYSVNPFRGGPGHDAVDGLQDVRAIVVAMAVLDRASRQIAPDLSQVATAFRDITAADLGTVPPTLMANIWQGEIDQNKLAADAKIPHGAAAQMRIYQRHFYLETD
jgi:prepilin-type N-terminal cleavage/methylation domain-containing protein